MSLLLDALKKAAKDKQAASAQSEGGGEALPPEKDGQDAVGSEQELVLNLDDDTGINSESGDAETAAGITEKTEKEQQQQAPAGNELSLELEQPTTTTSTVSDEALQMLIYKTNREYRRKQKAIWSGVAFTSAIILLLGGYYFYDNMVKDVESLERKHRIAIQKVNAEIIKQKRPELIADLTSAEKAEEIAGQVAVQPVEPANSAADKPTAKKPVVNAASKQADARATARKVSFSRTRQQDPVAAWLENGWQAYNRGEYEAAEQHYAKVLQSESDNRDALLGLAAIAMKQNRLDRAESLYARLIRLDPRDPIAVAALANLKQAKQSQQTSNGRQFSELSESKLKILLKQQPDSAPINFALGNISAQQSRWPQAQSYYFNAWMADESNPDYAYNLAVSLDQIGKSQQAKRFYRRSLELAANQNHSFSPADVRRRLQVLER